VIPLRMRRRCAPRDCLKRHREIPLTKIARVFVFTANRSFAADERARADLARTRRETNSYICMRYALKGNIYARRDVRTTHTIKILKIRHVRITKESNR
jgi:hypothetical protein